MTKCFEVQEDGSLTEVQINQENSSSSSIYFFIDHNRKIIYLWKGKKAGFRKAFAAAKAATNLPSELGPGFEVQSIDEGDEPYEFKAVFRQG
ncbi:MAG: hypothetical protein ACW98Y_03945 [Candidatus Thorarchaeota archaeon]|jgi:hypothetical protein